MLCHDTTAEVKRTRNSGMFLVLPQNVFLTLTVFIIALDSTIKFSRLVTRDGRIGKFIRQEISRYPFVNLVTRRTSRRRSCCLEIRLMRARRIAAIDITARATVSPVSPGRFRHFLFPFVLSLRGYEIPVTMELITSTLPLLQFAFDSCNSIRTSFIYI